MRSKLDILQLSLLPVEVKCVSKWNKKLAHWQRLPIIGRCISDRVFRHTSLKRNLQYLALPLMLLDKLIKQVFFQLFLVANALIFLQFYLHSKGKNESINLLGLLGESWFDPNYFGSYVDEFTVAYLSIWLFIVLLGVFANPDLLLSSDCDYYLLHYLRIPAKKYTLIRYLWLRLSNYIWLIISWTVLRSLGLLGLNMPNIFLFASFYLTTRLAHSGWRVFSYRHIENITRKRNPLITYLLAAAFGLAFVLVATAQLRVSLAVWRWLTLGLAPCALIGLYLLLTFKKYYASHVVYHRHVNQMVNQQLSVNVEVYKKDLAVSRSTTITQDIVSLQNLWFKRHFKALCRAYKTIWIFNVFTTIVIFVAFFIGKKDISDIKQGYFYLICISYCILRSDIYWIMIQKTFDRAFYHLHIYDCYPQRKYLFLRRFSQLWLLHIPSALLLVALTLAVAVPMSSKIWIAVMNLGFLQLYLVAMTINYCYTSCNRRPQKERSWSTITSNAVQVFFILAFVSLHRNMPLTDSTTILVASLNWIISTSALLIFLNRRS